MSAMKWTFLGKEREVLETQQRDDDERRARFARLLECEDVDLLEWFTRRSQPEDPELRAFVAELLDRVAQKG
jgi:antitoxin CptB